MNITVEIALESNEWDACPEFNSDYFADILQKILSRYPNFCQIKDVELSILLTNDKKTKLLNNEFRGKNYATNVLSFPDNEINWRQILEFSVDKNYMYLGDIAFAYEIIKKEADIKSVSFFNHFTHLVIHAILHLIGYNHMDEEEAEVMEKIEVEILDSYGISSPY